MKKLLPLLLIPTLMLCGCSQDDGSINKTIYAFDTQVSIKLYDGSEENLEDIANILYDYSKLSDNYLAYEGINNVYTINHANGEYVGVDQRLYEMIEFTLLRQDELNGYFNILIGDLSQLWKDAIEAKEVPAQATIDSLVTKMNNSHVDIDGTNKVKIVGEASIDLGAVAKGYALWKVRDYITEKGLLYYLIDGGRSSIMLTSKNADGDPYRVGLNGTNDVYELKNVSIGTSSISEQSFSKDGATYSHIVNPITGSALAIYDTIMVVGGNPGELDMISTACMVMSDITDIYELEDFYHIAFAIYQNGQRIYLSDSLQ